MLNNELNLSVHHPHSGTCNKCDFTIKYLQRQKELHQRLAENAIKSKTEDKLLAQQSNNNEALIVI
jgi:hypothetical protein